MLICGSRTKKKMKEKVGGREREREKEILSLCFLGIQFYPLFLLICEGKIFMNAFSLFTCVFKL